MKGRLTWPSNEPKTFQAEGYDADHYTIGSVLDGHVKEPLFIQHGNTQPTTSHYCACSGELW